MIWLPVVRMFNVQSVAQPTELFQPLESSPSSSSSSSSSQCCDLVSERQTSTLFQIWCCRVLFCFIMGTQNNLFNWCRAGSVQRFVTGTVKTTLSEWCHASNSQTFETGTVTTKLFNWWCAGSVQTFVTRPVSCLTDATLAECSNVCNQNCKLFNWCHAGSVQTFATRTVSCLTDATPAAFRRL